MESNMPWTARAYQGPVEAIEAARAALQAALEDGTYTAHQIAMVMPAFGEPPGPPALMDPAGEVSFGFAMAEGVEHAIPPGCKLIQPRIAAVVMGVGGLSSEQAED
jgi:hypothetical protein